MSINSAQILDHKSCVEVRPYLAVRSQKYLIVAIEIEITNKSCNQNVDQIIAGELLLPIHSLELYITKHNRRFIRVCNQQVDISIKFNVLIGEFTIQFDRVDNFFTLICGGIEHVSRDGNNLGD